VSGGEKKRTNIGMELIIEPQVLFLDEPTTGLDAHTAVSVVSLLKNLSVNEKRVIVLSIHQPRYSIFKLFDSLTLLSQGSTVYHGPAHLALAYFDKLGLHCEEHENPADFFLDTIIHYEKQLHKSSQETTVAFTNTTVSEKEAIDESAVSSESGEKMVRLVESYRKSEEYGELRERIDPVLQNVVEEKRKEPLGRQVARMMFTRELYATSFLWQLLIVTMRSVKNLMRSPQLSVFQLFFTSGLAVIIGIIYWQLDTQPNGFTDRVGVFFFVATNQAFGSLGAVRLFIVQKALFIHENASGYYRVSAFFISKITTDLIPLRFLPNLLFTIIVYFMIGFQVKADKFFIFWLILTLVNVCAVSIAFFISAGVRNGEIANLLIILPFIFSLLFAGLLISLDSLPVWVAWMRHFSFMKYGIEAFSINEMNGLRFQGPCQVKQVVDVMQQECTSSFTVPNNCTTDCAFDGLAQLGQLGYGNTVSVLWWDVFALVLYSSIFLVLAYVVLRLIKKEK
jgi:ATP-binding cassette subfamily G (WHITE) protein 2